MAVRPTKNGKKRRIVVYDTTLRDGAQGSFVTFSVADKLLIARALDRMGVDYIEGGFPGSNPKDEEFFASLRESPLKRSRLAAFGATRRAGGTCEGDVNLAALARSGAPTWTLVGKSDTWQVDKVLQATLDENLAMIRESVAFGVAAGHEVIFDAEHLFDGFARDRDYALEVCAAAAQAGAAWVVLCDTNGGSLPTMIRIGVEAVVGRLAALGKGTGTGIHTHNDCELAVANSIEGIAAGADMVQGTINGYGERCGNANLISVVANVVLKLGLDAMPSGSVARFTDLSRTVAEIANLALPAQQPFVGQGAFAHKGGQHVAAVLKQAEATVKVEVGANVYHTAASGNGPVNALDAALRKALIPGFPALKGVRLIDYKVRILDGAAGTGATTRVLVESGKGSKRWATVGCSSNIIEASLEALLDALEYAARA